MRKSEATVTVNLRLAGDRSDPIDIPEWAQAFAVFADAVNFGPSPASSAVRIDAAPKVGHFGSIGVSLSDATAFPVRDRLATECQRLRLCVTAADADGDEHAEFRVVFTDAQGMK